MAMRRPKRRHFHRRKVCRLCQNKEMSVDYKDIKTLSHFVTDRGKIVPRRISHNCAKCQRKLTVAIKRARQIALIPYTTHHNI